VWVVLDVFTVLAEPRRREILDLLREGEASVTDLVERLDANQPAVSKHLRVLRDSGLVDVRPSGKRRLYRLDDDALKDLDRWLAPYRIRWARALHRLEDHLAATRTPDHAANDRHSDDDSQPDGGTP
jgi:DNA-binding transcriptional ArsR family regulator